MTKKKNTEGCGAKTSALSLAIHYLCGNYVVLYLVWCNWDMVQNDLQPHCHHAGHPVDQAGADVAGHTPLETKKNDKPFNIKPQLSL